MDGCDRNTLLTNFRKSFVNFLKTSKNERTHVPSQLLTDFLEVMDHFTPDDLFTQFKEILSFLTHISDELVLEVRRRANSENTREAAIYVYNYIRAEPNNCQGWMILKSIIFIVNSGCSKIFDTLCKTSLPNTLIKVSYLFMDLPDADNSEEAIIRRRLYDTLIMLIMNLCSQPVVAEELIQKDDLFLLFIGASSRSNTPDNIWRNANFTFLCSIVGKALTPPVLKYIHSKGCLSHYLTNIRTIEENEQTILLCNLLDLLRTSVETTQTLIDDFSVANGFQFTIDTCIKSSCDNTEHIFSALTSLITAGNQTVQFNIPKNANSFHNQQMTQSISRSTGTIRNISAYKVLEQCFTEGNDRICILVLEKFAHLFHAERMNYFIIDESSSLFLIVETMLTKGVDVQEKLLELVENVLRVLNYIPYKEISSLNLHLKNVVQNRDLLTTKRILHFLLKIISLNANLKDAFRELSILETFLHIVQSFSSTEHLSDPIMHEIVQMAMDSLISTTKGNVQNAQYITENIDVKLVKNLLLEASVTDDLRTSISMLIKNLLYLAKNEQLFSSMLQLLFSEPDDIELCTVILKLINNALLESHKVRVMFRRSGGFICLMTLLLHLENSIGETVVQSQKTLGYISLIFNTLIVSVRYEPSNSKYFQTEIPPNIIDSILRAMGCFNQNTKIDVCQSIWTSISCENCALKFALLHKFFQQCSTFFPINQERKIPSEFNALPSNVFNSLFVLRLLFDLAIDNYEKKSYELNWASDEEWLRNSDNMESIPLLTWNSAVVIAHPTVIISLLHLIPSIGLVCMQELNEWSATAQVYTTLVLKALLRLERNQQVMCLFDMPKELLNVGEALFKVEKHPLLSSFHYFFERLAYQSLHPSELRHFLRLDKPLCCTNLDDDENAETNLAIKPGGPLPIYRIKAFVSMLTPRHHSHVHSPAFVEFDLGIEGFASLLIPSIANLNKQNGQQSGISTTSEFTFQPSLGFTLTMWININDNFLVDSKCDASICLFSIVRNHDGLEACSAQIAANIENCLTLFKVQYQNSTRTLLISSAEHSLADELRKGFQLPLEHCIKIPLSEQYFPPKQWAHLAIVVNRATLLKPSASNVEVLINGRSLANQKLSFAWNTQLPASITGGQYLHAYVGTLPFLRKPTKLSWKLTSLFLIEDAIPVESIRKIATLGVAYIGNLQCANDGLPLLNEDKILLSINPISTAEINVQAFRSMSSEMDTELIASLMGISPNDTSTPLRILWNMANNNASATGKSTALGGVLIGYLGVRTFAPSPVSSLLDSIGGLAPLFGLVAMSTDSSGLYASLKVLVSAMCTNRSIYTEIYRTRGFQTLAILLEEKAQMINSHILHLLLTMAGTIDGSKGNVQIPCLQTFDDLLCDLDIWRTTQDDVWKLLMEHFLELVIDTSNALNLQNVRASTLLHRLLIYLYENRSTFPIQNDIVFRLIGAIVQSPCDSQSMLRLGQTISATISFDLDETEFPFLIVDLEKYLLQKCMEKGEEDMNFDFDQHLYAVYMRNRLLNILCSMFVQPDAKFHYQMSELLVKTLGFGWILALCGPRVHQGTLFLAIRILVNVLRYPNLVDKFRDGSANGGWLSDADSVIRNRAAVLLGFTVAAQAGAVGSHVDINPELDKFSGFASLEHIAYAHADKSFIYLAMLAILFQQGQVNIQPLEEFNIESIWTYVFKLSEQSSVAHTIEKANFNADAIILLLAMIRAGLHKQFETEQLDKDHWCRNYPLMLLQFFAFLYQNSAQFFAICHTEAFIVVLFSSLMPPTSSPQTPSYAKKILSNDESGSGNRCVKLAVELLTNILLNDLSLNNDNRTESLFDTLIEFVDSSGHSHNRQSFLFTELVNACLDHFMASKMFFINSVSAPLIVPQSAQARLNQSSEQTSANVVRFLSRVIDTVWNCLYKGNPIKILKCFLKLLAEAHASNKAVAQLAYTDAHITSLFRLILYLLSRPIDNIDTQMCVLDTLAEIVRNQHLFLTPKCEINPLFYAALVHLIFMLSDRPQFDQQDPRNKQLERGTAQVTICAQSVWGILWQCKKEALEEFFKRHIDLDLYTARATCSEQANRAWLQFVDLQTDITSSQRNSIGDSAGRLLAQKMFSLQIQTKLSKVAKTSFQRLSIRKSTISHESDDIPSLAELFKMERLRVEPETFYIWIRVHISLLKELIRNNCQRYHEWHAHVRKWCLQEWNSVERDLTREKGLWGPDHGSVLDKFQLDVTEGPCRIRKKLVSNPDFYCYYPYRPNLEYPEAKPLRAKVAISRDSKLYYQRMCQKRVGTMDERIVDFQAGILPSPGGDLNVEQQFVQPPGEFNISIIKRMVQKNLELNNAQNELKKIEKEDKGCENGILDAEDDDEMQDDEERKSIKTTEEGDASPSSKITVSKNNSRESVEPLSANTGSETNIGQKLPEQQTKNRKRMSITESVNHGPDNQTLLKLLEQGEQLHSMFRCARIQGLDTIEGLLLFGKEHFYIVDGFTLLKTREIRDLDFLPEQYHDPIIPYIAMGCRNRPLSTKINRQCNKFTYEDIKEVHKRRYLLQQIALEVFSADGRNFLLAFPRKVRDRVYQKIVSMAKNASNEVVQFMNEQRKLRPSETITSSSQFFSQLIGQQSITQKWQRCEISNFHYLMYLNTLAGRSYNDLSQYPVFPWIIADYTSDNLDLTNPTTFRDLSKPMGAQNPDRLEQFLKRYREWDDPSGTPPYMYGTHYSSAMIVLSYLVRLEPFTQQFLKLQGGHFDLADRMFHSIGDAYMSASKNNMADVKELIPEFFYLPEMFLNSNNFDLGVKQSGVQLNNVQLPPWANDDVHEFVRLHRQALESDYVSDHLHDWIDLVFGYKQTGEYAKEANNVFHHLFYETGVDIESIEDPLMRNATLGFINNFGQIPSQLFKKPHPQRKNLQTNQQQFISVIPGVTTQRLFYHYPETLRVSSKPIKELRAAVGDIIVNEKNQVIVLEQNKLLIPPSSFLAWGFYDRSIRFGNVGQDKSTCVLETNNVYEITCMVTADGRQVFAGLSTGTILVWTFNVASNRHPQSARLSSKKTLDGHSDVITTLTANSAHNILVSGSRDKTAIIWHLTRLNFIRQLTGHPGPLTAVAVNDAKGDISTASGAFLFIWTVNGVPLAMINTSDSGLFSNQSTMIYCIAFSTMNDWDENNIVLCGTNDGLVKMYSFERKLPDHESDSIASDNSYLKASSHDPQMVKEHLLKRQQRISHHYQRITKSETISQDGSQMSSPLHSISSISFRQSRSINLNVDTNIKWKGSLRLRRILSEHTAYAHGNTLPAPITSICPTKDHRSVFVGDGVGRIWIWTSIDGQSTSPME